MTSEHIKQPPARSLRINESTSTLRDCTKDEGSIASVLYWLKEIAYQLAVMNETRLAQQQVDSLKEKQNED
jgi:hypothetical protein